MQAHSPGCQTEQKHKIPPQNISVNLGDYLPINEIHTSLLETTVEQQQVEVANIRRRVQEKPMVLMSQVEQCTNTDALLSAERNITSAMSVLNVIDYSTAHIATMVTKQLHPSNKYISKQRSFFSTRSRHENPKRRYAKPSRQEEEQIKEVLLHYVKLYFNSETKEINKG